MPFKSIAPLNPSSATEASNQFGFDALFSGQERRRGLWSFLTWAFILADAARGEDAYAAAAREAADPDYPAPIAPRDEPPPASLAGDEPVLKDWGVAFPPDGTLPGPGTHSFPTPSWVGSFDKLDLGDQQGSHPVPGGAASSGGAPGWYLGGAGQRDASALTETQGALVDLGLDTNAASPSFGAELTLSSGLASGLDAGLLSLQGLGGAPILQGLVGSALANVVEQAESSLVSAIDGWVAVAQDLVGGSLALGGLLRITTAPDNAAVDDLFVGGRYTDYHLSLQVEAPSASSSLPIALGGNSADLVHMVVDLLPVHSDAAAGPGTGNCLLPSAIDEFSLRGAIDHLV